MIQTKYICSSYTRNIDEDVNEWIKENSSKVIVDIKFAGEYRKSAVLIVYKDGGIK